MTALTTAVLDIGWLFRKRDGDDDYGIDGDVEIFLDEDTTGLEFPVQVKGTSKLNGRPKTRIEWENWEYWRGQTNPVLVVLWEKQTARIWWEWNHRFDTTGLDRQSRRFTFRFPEDQVWDSQTPSKLVAEIKAWRAWSHSLAHLPLSVVVKSSEDVGGISTQRIVGRLRQRLARLSDVLELRRDHPGILWLDIHIASSETAIWVSGGPSVVIHHEQAEREPPEPENQDAFIDVFTGDLLIGMARHLAGIGARVPGARVAEVAVEDASAIFDPQIALPILDLLIESQKWDGVHKLLVRVLLGSDEILAHMVFRLLDELHMDGEDWRRIALTLRYCVHGLANGFDDAGRAARLSYNASVVMRAGDPQLRLEFLNEAARLDPAYKERGYWWREVGGCLFLADEYARAAKHYQEALNRGEAAAGPLLADALMFSGRYKDARTTLDEMVDDWETTHPEWRLKRHTLNWLIDTIGFENQDRDTERAEQVLGSANSDIDQVLEALRLDAIYADALWELGHHLGLTGQRSVDAFLAAALAAPHSVGAWAYTIAFSDQEAPAILHDVVSCARRHVAQDLLSAFEVSDAPPEVVSYLEELLEHVDPEEEPPLDVRLAAAGSSTYALLSDFEAAGAFHEEE